MLKRIVGTGFVVLLAVIFEGCNKGCKDPNSDNYDPDAKKSKESTCKYRYAAGVTFKTLPSTKSNGNYWDSAPFDADVYLRFKPGSSSSWNETLHIVDALSGSIANQYTNDIKFTNEDWDWEIRDRDGFSDPTQNDLVDSGVFNPLVGGDDNTLKINGVYASVEFAYEVSSVR